MPAAVQGGLSGIPVAVDHQRVKVDPPAPWGRELDPVRTPVRLHAVVQVAQDVEDLVLVARVEVDVDVAVRSRLSPDERGDTPPPFEPEPAADRAHSVYDRKNLGDAHAFVLPHAAIM